MNNFFYILTGVAFLTIIQCGSCKSIKCNPPNVKEGEKITVEIMFVSGYIQDLLPTICNVLPQFKDYINIELRMGSQASKNGHELVCGAGVNCAGDRLLACEYKQLVYNGTNIGNPCATMPPDDRNKVENCVKNHEADNILIANGQKRQKYGIPDHIFDTLALNGSYDPCINSYITSERGVKNYLCKLLGSASPCK